MPVTVAALEAVVTADISGLESGLNKASGDVESFGSKVNSATSNMHTVGVGMAAIGAAGGAMFGTALMGAAEFEQQMDFVGSALGGVGDGLGATEAQFASLSAQAMELGASTQYSANQVGQVQEALAKTGVSAEDLLSGATQGVLDLSAATGEDLVASANLAAGAMNTFGLSGQDIGRIADVTTGALNNSSMSLADFSTGMNYLSPILAQTGGDFDDAAAAIAYFNSQGMKGADAGVSLARMIDNLVRPKNKEAAAMFKQLGISAFDAEGQMKTVPDMLDNIQDALQGLNEQEQLELVSKLFGAESADVVLRSLAGAGDGIRNMNEDITQQGLAAEQAAQRMDNWKGDLETLGGAINAAGMNITSAFLPALRNVTQFATSVVDAFNGLPAPLQAVVGGLLAVGSAAAGGLGAALLLLPKIMEFKTAFTALKAGLDLAGLGFKGLLTSMGPIGIALAAVSIAILAYQNNWLGFRDAVNKVADAVGPKLQSGLDAAGRALKALGTALAPLGKAIADTAGRFKDWLGSITPLSAAVDLIGDAIGFVVDKFGALSTESKILIALFGPMGMAIAAYRENLFGIRDAAEAVVGALGNLAGWLGDRLGGAFQWVAEQAGRLKEALQGLDVPQKLQDAFTWLQANVGDKIAFVVGKLGDLRTMLGNISLPAPLQAVADWFGEHLVAKIQLAIDKFDEFARKLGVATEQIQEASANAQGGIQDLNDGAQDALNTAGLWVEGVLGMSSATEQNTQVVNEGAAAHYQWGSALQNSAASMAAQAAAAGAAVEPTEELSDAQKDLIKSYQDALIPGKAFAGMLQMWIPLGQDVLDVMSALGQAGQLGDGAGMAVFVDGMNDARQALDGVMSSMNQIAALGGSLSAAQDIAQKLVGDPGVYAVVDDLLAKNLITQEQFIAAQADEIRVVEANTAAQDALNVMRVQQMDALANTSEQYAAYLVTLSRMPAAEQAHALAMMDSANQAKVAAAYSAAYSVSLGEIPSEIGTDIIASAAQADPVLAGLLEDYGLIEMGADGVVTVTFPDTSQQALERFSTMFAGADVKTMNGLIEVRQSDGTTLVYDQFNNLVEMSGTTIPATVGVDLQYAGQGGPRDMGPSGGGVGQGIANEVVTSVQSADYSGVTTAVQTNVTTAVGAVNVAELNVATVGTDVVTAVATAITETGPELITGALNPVITSAITDASQTAAEADQIGADLVTHATQGITTNGADFSTQAQTMTSDAVTNATTTAGDAIGIGQEFVSQATTGIANDGGDFSTQGQTMVSDAVTNATTTAADAIGIGEEFVTQATAGITNNESTFSDAGSDMVQVAIDAATTAGAGMLAVGEAIGADLGQGLVNGMASMADEVASQAAALAAAAEQGTRARLNTRSPSKVFYAIGVDTIQGFINGMRDRVADVLDVVFAIGEDVPHDFADGVTRGTPEAERAAETLGERIARQVAEKLGLIHDAIFGELGKTGKDAKRALDDGFKDADLEDLTVFDEGWGDALQARVDDLMGDTGRSGGKTLKEELEDELTGSDLAGALTSYFTEAAASGDPLNKLIHAIPDGLQDLAQEVAASGASVEDLAHYFDTVVESGDVLNDWLTHLPKRARDSVQQLGEALLTGIQEELSGADLAGAINRYLIEVDASGNVLNKLLSDIPDGLQDVAKEIANSGIPFKSLVAYFEEVVASGDVMNDALNAIPKSARDSVQQLGDAIVEGLDVKEPIEIVVDLLEQLVVTVDRIAGLLTVAFDKMGLSASEGLAQGMLDGQPAVKDAASDLGDTALKALKGELEIASPSKAMQRVGRDTTQGFIDGALSKRGELLAAMKQLAADARAAFQQAKVDIKQAGADAGASFWQGMLSQVPKTIEAARYIANQAVKAAQTAIDRISAVRAGGQLQIDVLQNRLDELKAAKETLATSQEYLDLQQRAADMASLAAKVPTWDPQYGRIQQEAAALQKQLQEMQKAATGGLGSGAAVDAEIASLEGQIAAITSQYQSDQLAMTRSAEQESNKRIRQLQKEMKSADNKAEKQQLKAEIALEQQRLGLLDQLEAAQVDLKGATTDAGREIANIKIDAITAQLQALGGLDVPGMFSSVAASAADMGTQADTAGSKIRDSVGGGAESAGRSMREGLGGGADHASRRIGNLGVAAAAMEPIVSGVAQRLGLQLSNQVGGGGERAGKRAADGMAIAIKNGEPAFVKVVSESVEAATLNGEKIGKDFEKVSTVMIDAAGNKVKEKSKSFEQATGTVVSGAINAGQRDAHRGGNGIGADIGNGMLKGLKDKDGPISNQTASIVQNAIAAARRAAQAHSPSEKARDLGHDWGDGLLLGLQERGKDVARMAASLVPAGGVDGPEGSSGREMGANDSGGTTIINNHYTLNGVTFEDGEDWDQFFAEKIRAQQFAESR